MAYREIYTTDTIETLRVTFNGMAIDIGDIEDLNVPYVGTPTNIIEAVNTKATSEDLDSAISAANEYTDAAIGLIDHTTYETKVQSVSDDAETLASSMSYTDEQMLTASGATGGNDEQIFFINQTVKELDYTIPIGYNALTAGPIVENAVTTIPEGSCWVIV